MFFNVNHKKKGGFSQRCFVPDDTPEKEIDFVLKELSTGTVGIKDFSYLTTQTQKAYSPSDEQITLVAKGNSISEAEAKNDLYFVKQIASDTTIDTDRDKFGLPILQEFAKQYSEGWGDGITGGRAQCVMHRLSQPVGRTISAEIRDANNDDGTPKLDNVAQRVKELIVYGYVIKSSMYEGAPFVDKLKYGAMNKVSIQAWIPNYEYVPSDRSNFFPYGDGVPYGYFLYNNPEGMKVIELSFVTEGANENARLTKSLDKSLEISKTFTTESGEITVSIPLEIPTESAKPLEEKPTESAKTESEVTESATSKEVSVPDTVAPEVVAPETIEPEVAAPETLETPETVEIPVTAASVSENMAKALAIFQNLPIDLKDTNVTWVKHTLKNCAPTGAAKEYAIPSHLELIVKNLDKMVDVLKVKLSEAENKVKNLEKGTENTSEKAISLGLDLEKAIQEKTTLEKQLNDIKSELSAKDALINKERDFYLPKYISLKARLEDNVGKEEMIAAYTSHAKNLTIEQIRTQCDECQLLLEQKIKNKKLIESRIPEILDSEAANDF